MLPRSHFVVYELLSSSFARRKSVPVDQSRLAVAGPGCVLAGSKLGRGLPVGRQLGEQRAGRDRRFEINTGYDTGKIALGASIACSGPCLTVVEKGAGWFAVDALGHLILDVVSVLFTLCALYGVEYLRLRKERANRVFCVCLLTFLSMATAITVAMAAGLALIYASGIAWLALGARIPQAMGLRAALVAGAAPFLVADVVKLFVAAGTLPAVWRLTGLGESRRSPAK